MWGDISMVVATGAKGRLAYGVESSFNDGMSTASNSFGVDARLTGIGGRNNIQRLYTIGSREAVKNVALRFEGTWGVETTLSNTDIFSLLGSGSNKDPTSAVIEVGFAGATNVLRTLRGAVVRRASISTRPNEVVRVRMDGLYATEEVTNPESITPIIDTNEPFTFAGATITYGGVEVAKVQAMDVDITTGFELIYALGQRTAVDGFARAFEVGGRISAVAIDDTFVKDMLGVGADATAPDELGVATETSIVITLTNGTDTKTLTIGGVVIDDLGSSVEANELILFDATYVGRTLTIA